MPLKTSHYNVWFYSVPILKSNTVPIAGGVLTTTTYDMGNVRHHYLHCPMQAILFSWMTLGGWVLGCLIMGAILGLIVGLFVQPQTWWPWVLLAVFAGYVIGLLFVIEWRMTNLVREERGWDASVNFQKVRDKEWAEFLKRLQ